ncbi:MAG: cytochrome c oxidase assembly protein [Caldilineaceae bacterium]|nr:cytochrome c oxidase assembly protein [Caldilineaceae bacterium]
MNPLTRALLLSWDFRPEILVALTVLGALHFVGWLRLWRRSDGRFANCWRLASYTGGILVLALALLSPIAVLSSQLFSIHMVQHLLLMMVAPPLLLLANPFPTFLWAFPTPVRIAVAAAFRRLAVWLAADAVLGRILLKALAPATAWALYVLIFFAWHDGNAYSLALRYGVLHGLEHFTFFGAALLFWWHVIGAAPRLHPKPAQWLRVAYVLAMIPPNMLLGVALSFAETPIYPYYESLPRLYSLSVMDDQVWGGLIMWIPGSMMYVIAALALLARLLTSAEQSARVRNPHPPVMGLAPPPNRGGPTALASG